MRSDEAGGIDDPHPPLRERKKKLVATKSLAALHAHGCLIRRRRRRRRTLRRIWARIRGPSFVHHHPSLALTRGRCRRILRAMGNPFVHLDLATDDPAAAKKFYKTVFDWKFNDFPEMKWTGIDVGQGVGGGIAGKTMPTQPTAWSAYVDVTD